MLEIYLLRHGETEYNKHNLYIGGKTSNLPINETGILQSKKLGDWFLKNNILFDHAFCSTATRAKQTLEHILEKTLITSVQYSKDLEELSQGDWEGQLRENIYTPEQLRIINSNNYKFKAPNGESQEEVENRMYKYIDDEILKIQSGKILIVSHGIAIKCLLRKILNSTPSMTYKIKISNTSLSKLLYSSQKAWEIEYINRVV